ncbi:MAG: hypothetical protein RIR97_1130 [Pseudomonadota bacterium]|jgi:ABC-type molybdate transport system substrate-binding protein
MKSQLTALYTALVLLVCVLFQPVMAQEFKVDGWWIVMAAFKENAANRDESEAQVRTAAAACGVEAFNDFSTKFAGFTPGLTVVVSMGAYASKTKAESALAKLKPCIPDAYVKKARYAGE